MTPDLAKRIVFTLGALLVYRPEPAFPFPASILRRSAQFSRNIAPPRRSGASRRYRLD